MRSNFQDTMKNLGRQSRSLLRSLGVPAGNIFMLLLAVSAVIGVVVGILFLFGWLFMVLWNFALVGLFPSIPVLDFWRGVALVLFLSFFGSFFKSSK